MPKFDLSLSGYQIRTTPRTDAVACASSADFRDVQKPSGFAMESERNPIGIALSHVSAPAEYIPSLYRAKTA
ncbi:hypothetical protein DNP40_23645 [Salmonella enterica subsp. enterica serovar Panama]|nr:hypothetical protein DNP40_23645 [Salmonella enterica subsp. enterica serovar Panama]